MTTFLMTSTVGNWDDGRLVYLTPGATFKCNNLQNAVTAVFLYNAANADHDTYVTVSVQNSVAPKRVLVPGVTADQGLATIVVVNGNVTNSVTVSMGADQPTDSKVSAFIGSLAFPLNTAGITNAKLPIDGNTYPFNRFTRYYQVLAAAWYQLVLTSNVYQFYAAQFGIDNTSLTVYCLNPGPNPQANVVQADDTNPIPVKLILPTSGTAQKIVKQVFGNNQQAVWINADSVTDSQSATISLQQT